MKSGHVAVLSKQVRYAVDARFSKGEAHASVGRSVLLSMVMVASPAGMRMQS